MNTTQDKPVGDMVEVLSNCCGGYTDTNHMLCGDCGDHCAVIGVDESDKEWEWDDITNKWVAL